MAAEDVSPGGGRIAGIIGIEGLQEYKRNLRALDAALPKVLKAANNRVAQLVVDETQSRMPSRTGRARASVRVASTAQAVRIQFGGSRAPYEPWLDFGGTTGRGHKLGKNRGSIRRPRVADGRYVYPSFFDLQDSGEFEDVLVHELVDVARQSGLAVD